MKDENKRRIIIIEEKRMKRESIFKAAVVLVLMIALLGLGCSVGGGLKKKQVAIQSKDAAPKRTAIYKQDNWTIARGSIHNHTTYSDGCRSPEDLLELARIEGMAILAINDHREGKICLGDGDGICVKLGGIETVGYKTYFDHLAQVQKTGAEEGMILLKGVEVIPYFYNFGKAPHLVIGGLEEHFTVYGIDDPAIFEKMPVRHNLPSKPETIPTAKPWQAFVDYMIDNGAIVHAVHVEGKDDKWMGPAHGGFNAPMENLHRIRRLTGFSALPAAYHEKTGGPGGLWDTNLIEYLGGMNKKPMWAVGDADYHCKSSLAIANTLFYMTEFTEAEIYKCMREGRMIALMGAAFQDTYVSEWWVSDSDRPADKIMLGREIKISGAPTIGFALNKPVEGCKVRLIKNGVVIFEKEGTGFTYKDEEQSVKKEPAYYRVEVVGPLAPLKPGEKRIEDYTQTPVFYNDGTLEPDSELLVNPIFVRY